MEKEDELERSIRRLAKFNLVMDIASAIAFSIVLWAIFMLVACSIGEMRERNAKVSGLSIDR